MGLEARPTAAGFVFSALNHTSPIRIYLSASLCATPRSPCHCKRAYICCLTLISRSVGSTKAKANELHAITARCSLPPSEGCVQSVHQPKPRTHAAAARRCRQLIPALRNSRQSLSPGSDLTLTKPPLTGQRIRKNIVINGNIIPHSSSVRFCIYIRNDQWRRMMTAPYVNHTLYKEKLSSVACGR